MVAAWDRICNTPLEQLDLCESIQALNLPAQCLTRVIQMIYELCKEILDHSVILEHPSIVVAVDTGEAVDKSAVFGNVVEREELIASSPAEAQEVFKRQVIEYPNHILVAVSSSVGIASFFVTIASAGTKPCAGLNILN